MIFIIHNSACHRGVYYAMGQASDSEKDTEDAKVRAQRKNLPAFPYLRVVQGRIQGTKRRRDHEEASFK